MFGERIVTLGLWWIPISPYLIVSGLPTGTGIDFTSHTRGKRQFLKPTINRTQQITIKKSLHLITDSKTPVFGVRGREQLGNGILETPCDLPRTQ